MLLGFRNFAYYLWDIWSISKEHHIEQKTQKLRGVLFFWGWWRAFCDSKAYHNSYAAISSYTWIFLFSCIITMIVNAFKSHSSKEWNSFVKPMTPLGSWLEGDPSLISRMFTQNLTVYLCCPRVWFKKEMTLMYL